MKEINIELSSHFLPIKIGKNVFKYDLSDKGQELTEMKLKELVETVQKVSDEDSENFLKVGFDVLFGKGSYDKIYEECPSNLLLIEVFVEVAMEIRIFREGIEEKVTARKKYGKKK